MTFNPDLMDELLAAKAQADAGPEGDIAQPPAMTEASVAVPEKTPVMSLSEVKSLAEVMIQSEQHRGTSLNDAVMKVMLGRELGIPPALAMQNVIMVKGKATLSAAAVGAMIKQSKRYNYRVLDHTDQSCTIEFYEKWDGGEWVSLGKSEFTMEHARQAGLLRGGGAWSQYPRNMLHARALTNGARWYTPDVFGGPIYTPEELQPYAPEEPTQYREVLVEDSVDDFTPKPNAEPEPVALETLERTPWTEDKDELCPLHNEKFFKRGRMKSHAHKVGEEWCNWHDVARQAMKECSVLFDQLGVTEPAERQAFAEHTLPDLQGKSPNEFRIQDWYALRDHLIEHGITRSLAMPEPADDTETITDELRF